jgi:exosortase D (VPLPA-CTERM-specific)
MNENRLPTLIILALLILVASFLIFYKDVIIHLVKIWSNDGNYSHGFLVPFIVGYSIWIKRSELAATPIKTYWPALILIFISGLLLIAGQLSIHGFSKHLSLFVMILSLVLLVFGKQWFRIVLLPLSFLIFMFPLPELARRTITYPMQLLSSIISVEFLNMLGYAVHREGNIIQFPNFDLSVAEACSGLRSLVALTFLAAVTGYFMLSSNLKRLILFLFAFPVAIILNWTRIIGTAVLADFLGIESALGFFHNFSGFLIFGVAIILIGFLLVFLRKRDESPEAIKGSEKSKSRSKFFIEKKSMFAASALIILAWLFGHYLFSLKQGPVIELHDLPVQIGIYSGKDGFIDPSISERSNVTKDRSITFYSPDEPAIGLYLGYYRTGPELKGFFHGADVCLPGSGWKIIKKEKIKIELDPHFERTASVLKYVSSKRGTRQVMITWLQAGDLIGTGSRTMRMKLVADTMLNLRYNDLTKVMAQTIIFPDESQEDATKRLFRFIREFYPKFAQLIHS